MGIRRPSVFILFLVLLLFSASSGPNTVTQSYAQPSCPSNSILRMAYVGAPETLNPNRLVLGTASPWILNMEYLPTVLYNPNGSVTSNLVFDRVTHNANYSLWTFHVKPGLKWSSGKNVTSYDLLATEGPNYNFAPSNNVFGTASQIAREYAVNSSAAVFNLNVSNAWLPDYFSMDGSGVSVMPSALINATGPAGPNLGTDTVDSLFYVSNFAAGESQAVLYSNPHFNSTGYPEPKVCEIQIGFVDSLSVTAQRLESGAVDLAPIVSSDASAIQTTPGLHVLAQKGMGITTIQYDDSAPPYNSLAFRQALVYGINQSKIVGQAFSGYADTGYSSEGAVSPAAALWYNPNIQKYNFNHTTALQLLKGINYTIDSNRKLHSPDGSFATLTLWTDTDNTADLVVASIVQADLTNLGFQVNLQTTSASNIVGDYIKNLNNIRSGMIIFSTPATNYANPLVDVQPGWNVYWLPPIPNPAWLNPTAANSEWLSNFTAFEATNNVTLDQRYLFNMEALNAQYLPTTVLAVGQSLWGYSTARWTNWPSGYLESMIIGIPNITAWTNLTPVATTSNSGGLDTTTLAIIAAIAIAVVVMGVTFVLRKRSK